MGAVVVRRAQLHTEQEKIFTGVVDTGEWTVFIFRWRVFNFCLVGSKEKGSMHRHLDSSGLVSGEQH